VAESQIVPEVKERFPGLPVILVANKSDLSRDQPEAQADKRSDSD
jgi:GTPase SAR1 family protein